MNNPDNAFKILLIGLTISVFKRKGYIGENMKKENKLELIKKSLTYSVDDFLVKLCNPHSRSGAVRCETPKPRKKAREKEQNTMRQEDVAEYRKIIFNIDTYTRRLNYLKNQPLITMGAVQESSHNIPYELKEKVIFGRSKEALDKIWELEQSIIHLKYKKQAIENFVDSIENINVNALVWLYYISEEKPNWLAIAVRCGYSDEGTPRKTVNNFFKNLSENSE